MLKNKTLMLPSSVLNVSNSSEPKTLHTFAQNALRKPLILMLRKRQAPSKKIENTGQISKPVAAEEEEMIKSEDDSTNTKVTEKEEPKKAKQVSNLDPL